MKGKYNLSWTELLNEFIHKSYKLCFVNKKSRWSGDIFLDVLKKQVEYQKTRNTLNTLFIKRILCLLGV